MWMAGGGVKGGYKYGATDEAGFKAVDKPVHVHDLHATILHLLGFDHEKLTYRHAGRDFPPHRHPRQRHQRPDCLIDWQFLKSSILLSESSIATLEHAELKQDQVHRYDCGTNRHSAEAGIQLVLSQGNLAEAWCDSTRKAIFSR